LCVYFFSFVLDAFCHLFNKRMLDWIRLGLVLKLKLSDDIYNLINVQDVYKSLCFIIFVLYVVFSPLLRLSPPPSEKDYYFNLDENEGVCDLFDIPL